MPSDIIGRALTKTFQNTNCNRVTNKANCRSRGHSCLRHCSKILSKLRLLAVLRAGMPAAPTIYLFSLFFLVLTQPLLQSLQLKIE